uniref:Cytochrome P450 n=1 Tax=Bombyx mori TaxID=7091 RepID=A0A8R2M876_BOMMO|nr:uncharacterized protein LOC101744633 [Bombyx mori]
MLFSLFFFIFILSLAVLYSALVKKGRSDDPPLLVNYRPVVGHLFYLFCSTAQIWNNIVTLSKKGEKQGPVVRFVILTATTYIITHPETAVTVADSTTSKHYIYSFFRRWLREGLLTSSGGVWKRHRKLVSPSFNLRVLYSFMGVFNSGSKKLINHFRDEMNKGPLNVLPLIKVVSLESICQNTFGIEESSDLEFKKKFMIAVDKMLFIVIERIRKIWLHNDFLYNYCTSLKKEEDNVVKVLTDMTNKVLHKKQALLKMKSPTEQPEQSKKSEKKFKALLDLLLDLSAEDSLTGPEILEELNTAVFGGYDTTSCTLTYVLMNLGTYQDVQQKMYEEIKNVFGDSERDVESDDLSKLVYTEAVIKESLRLYPIAPIIFRELDQDVKINNYTLKAGRGCAINVYGINRHAMWGDDADKFRPERWLEPDGVPSVYYAFATFGVGKRACIGRTYAMMSMKTTLVHILRQFRIAADITKIEFKIEIILVPQTPCYLTLERRSWTGVTLIFINYIYYLNFTTFSSTYKMIILTVSLVIIIAVLGSWMLFYRHYKDSPPFHKGLLPIIGHSYLFMGDTTSIWRNLKNLAQDCTDKGGVLQIIMGFKRHYIITDPKDALTVANACLQKHFVYSFGSRWLGNGLITGSGEIWKRHRKLLSPSNSPQILNTYLGIFNENSRQLVTDLAPMVGEGLKDLSFHIRKMAMNTIFRTAFGVYTNEDENFTKAYMSAVDEILTIITKRFTRVWLQIDFIYNLTSIKKREDELIRIVNEMSNKIIARKRSELASGVAAANETDNKYQGLLDLMLKLAKEDALTDQEIREEVDTAIMAGFDTSSWILVYVLVNLGSFPEVQDRAYNEIMDVFGDSDRDLEKEDLSKLVYTEAVLKETMRLYTMGPVSLRHIEEDVKLKNFTLKAGTDCSISLFGINRHTVWGEDVNEFKPERWLDPQKIPDNAFAAFSIGKRSCTGRAYALTLMKINLAHLLRKYKISGDVSKLDFKFNFIIKPISGSEIGLEYRK